MKKLFAIAAMCCMLSIAALAQATTPDFSGTWTLDVSKSKLDDRSRVESMTLTVTQTAKDIKIDTKTTRAPRPEGAGGGMGGGGRRGGGFGGDSVMTYTLDGKTTTIQQESQMGQIPVSLTGKLDGGTLNLSSSRTFNGPNGEVTATTKDTWTLSSDGKTLTVNRESQTPRGANSSTMVFVKK